MLHGALGEQFGGPYRLDVASPAEALRALIVQLKGFREHLKRGHYRIIRKQGVVQRDTDERELRLGFGQFNELHIVPAVVGSGNSTGQGVMKIIAGVVLVAAAFIMPEVAIPLFGTLNAMAAGVGLSLALTGVSTLLARPPQLLGGSAAGDQRVSFLFGGQLNVNAQGGPVPLVYGRIRTGSVVVSAGLATEQI
jgi:predicted phage tail protein